MGVSKMEKIHDFVADLAAILVEDQVVSATEAQAMIADFKNDSQESFEDFLLTEGLVLKDDLLLALSRYYEVPAIDVQGSFFDASLVQSFPKDFLLKYGAIPLELDQEVLMVVTYNPNQEDLAGKFELYLPNVVEFRVGFLTDIRDAIREYFDQEPAVLGDPDDIDHEQSEFAESETLDSIVDERE